MSALKDTSTDTSPVIPRQTSYSTATTNIHEGTRKAVDFLGKKIQKHHRFWAYHRNHITAFPCHCQHAHRQESHTDTLTKVSQKDIAFSPKAAKGQDCYVVEGKAGLSSKTENSIMLQG